MGQDTTGTNPETRANVPAARPVDPFKLELMIVCDACGSLMKGAFVLREECSQQTVIAVDKCPCNSPLVSERPSPFTGEQHHELCLGVMARCYPFVDEDLKQAIREGIESARLLGIPIDCRNLEQGGPLFNGGHA